MNYWTKYLLKKVIRLTPQYFKYKKRIGNKITFDDSYIREIIKEVPYYREQGYTKDKFMNYPFLTKSDVIGNEDKFISKKINKSFLIKVSTSGSSGESLNFCKTLKDIIKEEAFVNHAFSLIGKNLRIAVLRGNSPSSGIFEYKFGRLLLSSYLLSRQNILDYLKLIRKYKINCLYVYPSSMLMFCRYLKLILEEKKIELPEIQGIISSSEIFSESAKAEIKEIFPGSTIVDIYGQSEHVAFAIAVDKGYFHFFDSYSIVEFLDTGLKNGGNSIKEIVGTNLTNKAMPLIKYRTAEYVEVDSKNNVVSIIGRANDLVVDRTGKIMPCNLATRDRTLKNVLAVQYYQDKAGELNVMLKVNNKFTNRDRRNIYNDMQDCFQELMQINIEIVDEVEKTSNGKIKPLIQKLDLTEFQD